MTEKYKMIGRNVRKYRKLQDLTQEKLAMKTSISLSYITNIEAPNTNKSFSLEVLHDISYALDVKASDLLEGV